MDSRVKCRGRCRQCGTRACVHKKGHYGPCQCAQHASTFLNSIVGLSPAMEKWLGAS